MIGIYFSGNGNTKYGIETFVKDYKKDMRTISIEDTHIHKEIQQHQTLIIEYPIYYSNLPKIMHDFIIDNASLWKGKNFYLSYHGIVQW